MSFIKSLSFFLFLSFMSCYSGAKWRYSVISTGTSEYDIAQLTFPSSAYLHDMNMEIQFLYSDNTLNFFIHVFSKEIPSFENNPKLAMLKIQTQDGLYEVLCDRYSGGQKVKIPPESTQLILNLLRKYDEITLSLSTFYTLTVSNQGLDKCFNRLKTKLLPFRSHKPFGIAF